MSRKYLKLPAHLYSYLPVSLKTATAVSHHHHLTPAIWQRRAALAFSLHFVHSHSLLFIRKRSEFFIDSIPIPDPISC